MLDIEYYADRRGIQEVNDWIQHIEQHEPASYHRFYLVQHVLREIGVEIQAGKQKTPGGVKKLRDDIWQMRVNDNRVLFFFFENETIVFTNQFKKKQNKTPQHEIDRAVKRRKEWLENNRKNK